MNRVWKSIGPLVTAALKSLARAGRVSHENDAKDMAASIAYFSFFSLFPMLLVLIAGASLFFDLSEVHTWASALLTDALPGSAKFVFYISRVANLEAI